MLQRLRRLMVARHAPPTLSSLQAYAQWADTYPPHAHNPLMTAEQEAMLALCPDLVGCTVLDLACGSGRYGLLARERGAQHTIGLDNSLPMLTHNPSANRALATLETLPLAASSVDVVICGLAFGHLPDIGRAMREISRVLRPTGWALVSDFHALLFLAGGRRTFTASDHKTYAVEHYPHHVKDYQRAGHDAGLEFDELLEAYLATRPEPAVVVLRWKKP